MGFDPKLYRNSKDGIGSPGDDKATDVADPWTLVALQKGILYELQNPAPVSVGIATATAATLTTLASAATSAQLLPSTPGRKGLMLVNTDANSVYIKYGTTASATSFTVIIGSNAYWEMPQPIYTGRIDAIWDADGSGSLFATELT